MRLKTKFFLLIGGLFVCTIVLFTVMRQVQLHKILGSATEKIREEIIELDKRRRENILTYLSISLAEMESKIKTVFRRIEEYGGLKSKYAPSEFNYETNDWSSSSVLMASNEWIDFVQTVNHGKLTSLIIARPPYLNEFIRVAIDDFLSVFFIKESSGNYAAFIGVPYWSNSIVKNLNLSKNEMIFNNHLDRDQWLLFTLDQLLTLKKSDLVIKNFEIPSDPLEPSISIKGGEVFSELVNLTIKMIFFTQEKILGYPEWIKRLASKQELQVWAEKNLKAPAHGAFDGMPSCSSQKCPEGSNVNASYVQEIQNWALRYDQNELIWEILTITASGIWNFDPIGKEAPKGIVSFQRKEDAGIVGSLPYTGMGLLSDQVFFAEKIPVLASCAPSNQSDDTCISNKLQIVNFDDERGIFLVDTLVFTEKDKERKPIGNLSIGINIDPMLQKLALASPDSVLFLDHQGKGVIFNAKGTQSIKSPRWQNVNFNNMITEKSGTIKDIDGHEYLFIHVTSLTPSDGHIFIIEMHQGAFEMLKELNVDSAKLLERIMFEFIGISVLVLLLCLLVLNQILKHVIEPIQELALATKAIGSGHLAEVNISQEGKKRNDEIGVLCRSFEQMCEQMKAGEKVRDILNKVVSKEIAAKIIKEGVELGGETREVTVLFSDIRNFTHIAEKMDPRDVLNLLNDCLTVLSRVIDDHAGVIDKYVGDEIMALFGAPVETKNAALEAVLCAIEMQEVLAGWNRQRKRRGLLTLDIGIAVHTGNMISGNIGAENHLNYTVLGHNVNLASRLCDHAGKGEILITDNTLNASGVRDKIKWISLPPVELKGISVPIQIYRVDGILTQVV